MNSLENAYALLIGIGNDLPITVRDATAIHNILADKTLAGYKTDNITLLTEKYATREGILNAFDDLISKINEDSSVLLFYSGHGGYYEPWNQFYLVPNNYDPDEYETTWVKAEELKEKIQQIKSKRLVFFLDCCHAAGMTKAGPGIKNENKIKNLNQADGLAQKIDDGKGISIVSSCREDQLSYIMEGDNNSLFTKCLIEVLKGKHKNYYNEEYIRISEVVQYIFKMVPERNPEQKPYANLQIYDDFVLSYIPENLRNYINLNETNSTIENNKGLGKEIISVFKEEENANNAILFVHGFSGLAHKTFGDIPKYLMEEKDMKGWDMFPFGFTASVKPIQGNHNWASIHDINLMAGNLVTSIKYKFEKYNRIAIVAHSLGGIVAQRAILDMEIKDRERIKFLFLFGTPNNGLKSSFFSKMMNKNLKDISNDSIYIQNLRKGWNETFNNEYPFNLKVIASTQDEFVPIDSNFSPFKKDYCITISGNHESMVQPESRENDSYELILNTLKSTKFLNQYTESEEINLVLGEYEAVINKLLPKLESLDSRGLTQLIFALEGVDRGEEAIKILEENPLSKDNGHVMGLMAGRYKRKFLQNYIMQDGENASKYYKKGLEIAEKQNVNKQIYYHAINLGFLNLVLYKNENEMRNFAYKALDSCKKETFENLWKFATIAEANLYLGNIDEAKTFYSKSAKMAGLREKLSIYTNAYHAYTILSSTTNEQDSFIVFLKSNFLN